MGASEIRVEVYRASEQIHGPVVRLLAAFVYAREAAKRVVPGINLLDGPSRKSDAFRCDRLPVQ